MRRVADPPGTPVRGFRFGRVAAFKSEPWPASFRNGGRHQIGMPGRNASEFAAPRANAEYVRQSRIDPTPRICPLLSENTLQGTGTHRTSGRQARTLQAYRTSMREDGAELRLVRRACSRLHLDQIRPHDLARC